MKTIIIAAAPIDAARFQPVYAKFPISDSVLLDCMGSQKVTEEILEAGCRMLGLDKTSPRVCGLHYKFPERQSKSFEEFLEDLEFRYRRARRQAMEESYARYSSRRPAEILQAIMKL